MAKKQQKVKRFSIQAYDDAHYKTTEAYVQAVQALYDAATKAITKAAAKGTYDPEKPFSFNDYPSVKAVMQVVSTQLADRLTTTIESGSRKEWLFSCKKNDGFIASIMDTSKLSKATLNKMQDRRLDALSAFQGRKVDGLGLSQRVWKYVDQYKAQMESTLDVGLGEGRSAQQLARDVKQNLQDPNRLFRRVRDKRGNLVLSKAAKAFHPGIGVYRSSVKNAQRLTRSEINMAYRESDYQRWQGLDFVLGYEIRRSNHEPLCKCKLCQRLVGCYPKWFKFIGWHPQCMCYAVPILTDFYSKESSDDRVNEMKAALFGTKYKKYVPKETITDVPDNFKEWVKEHLDAQETWASTPYFIKDNFKNGKLSEGLKFKTTEQPKIDPIQQQLDALQAEIVAMRQMCYDWGLNTFILDEAIKKRKPNDVIIALWQLKDRVNNAKNDFDVYLVEAAVTIKEAKKHKVDATEVSDDLQLVKSDRREWVMAKASFKNALLKLKEKIKAITQPTSKNVPDELKPGCNHLNGENYTFDNDFFGLIDPKRPIRLEIHNSDKGSYSSHRGDLVYIAGAKRGKASPWKAKAVIYHEYGHCIDAQRTLWQDKALLDMRAKQIKWLKGKCDKTLYVRKWDYTNGGWIWEKESFSSRVAYIDKRLEMLCDKVFSMDDATFTKRGITKMDVIEQIGSTRDTIKSLVIKYGGGHSTAYFRKARMKETEYLAHAFENAFLGNRVFQKVMPDIYNEMIAYIKTLKPL